MSKETLVDKSRQNTASSLSHETPCHSETRWHRAGHWCIFPQDDQPTAWHLWNSDSSSSVSMVKFWFLCCCMFGEYEEAGCSTSLGIRNWSEDALDPSCGWRRTISGGQSWLLEVLQQLLMSVSTFVAEVSCSSVEAHGVVFRTCWLEKQSNWHGQNHGGDCNSAWQDVSWHGVWTVKWVEHPTVAAWYLHLKESCNSTLYKMARSFWRYFECMKGWYGQSFHLDEERLYWQICYSHDSHAAPAAAQSFLEPLNFFKGILGFCTCNIDSIIRPCVKGAV